MSLSEHIVVKFVKPQINYIAGKMALTYEQVVERLQEYLEYIKENTIRECNEWIDTYVPKRTGQLRYFLKLWLEKSTLVPGLLRITLRTSGADYAAQVNAFATVNVAHSGEIGYVYYDNVMGIWGRVVLNDPQAIGGFWDALINFTKETVLKFVAVGRNIYFGPGSVSIKRKVEKFIEK